MDAAELESLDDVLTELDRPAAMPRFGPRLALAEPADAALPTTRERRHELALLLADAVAASIAVVLATAGSGLVLEWWVLAVGVATTAVLAKFTGLRGKEHLALRRSTLDEVPQLLQFAGLMTLVYWLVLADDLGRGGVVVLLLAMAIGLPACRAAARFACRRIEEPERCLFLGDPAVIEHVRRKVDHSRANARFVGALTVRPGDGSRALGGVEELRRVVRVDAVERIIVAPASTDAADTLELIRMAQQACTRVSLVPRLFEAVGSAVEFEDLDGVTLIGVRRFGLSRSARAVKRGLDVVGSSVGLVVLAPVLAVIAAAIRLDSGGPVLFRQTRVGRDGRRFVIVKFRTMVPEAEQLKDGLRHRNELEGLFKLADDPRITRVGRFLRRTSLDELPQLVNVLRGDMSLVGPRPLVVDEDRQITGLDRARSQLTPGMTGPWQVLQSGRVPMVEMIGLDDLYVANWSLWSDVKLLVRTVPYVLRRRGL